MRSIRKGQEPSCLADLRREALRLQQETGRPPTGHDWCYRDCGQTMRDRLVVEQSGLCAYCMQRIKAHAYRSDQHTQGGMKIEHFLDRSSHPEDMYDWDNLLGVCGGEYRGPRGLTQHCDTSRGARPLQVHPASTGAPRPEDAFRFQSSPLTGPSKRQGLWIVSAQSAYQSDIDALVLNAEHLVHNRWQVLDQLRTQLARCANEAQRRLLLRRRLKTSTTPVAAKLPPFAPLVADYVRGKMRAKAMAP